MKKLLVVILLALTLSLFAENGHITVLSVTGRVKVQSTTGTWEVVTEDTVLSLESFISTGLNSSIILSFGEDEIYEINAIQKGSIADLTSSMSAGGTGLKIKGTLTKSDVNADDIQERTNISTASTRADAVTDDELEWAEDE
ncbi:MAG: hypothetical protein OCD02_19485 [Spirochaetaceae bacterium]